MSTKEASSPNLSMLRASIDNLNVALINILAERFKLTHEIGVYKLAQGLSSVTPEREQAQFERFRTLAAQAGLDPDWAQSLLAFIIREVVARHDALKTHPRS